MSRRTWCLLLGGWSWLAALEWASVAHGCPASVAWIVTLLLAAGWKEQVAQEGR